MKVVIIQRVVPHYRLAFFRELKRVLEDRNIEFQLVYGQEKAGTVPKTVMFNEPWAIKISNSYFATPFGEMVWQPCWALIKDAELVIVEQANRLIINYIIQFLWRGENRKFAFWGHGANFQSISKQSLKEQLKRFYTSKADWWFAYTTMSVSFLESVQFPRQKITVVQNSIDTSSLENAVQKTTNEQLRDVRKQLGLTSNNIAIYCGALYSDKRIDFLLNACDELSARLPDFSCIIIGDGPESHKVEIAAKTRNWLHYLGPKYYQEQVPYFLVARVLLMPGLVGLVVVDSFVTGTPLITTDIDTHSPEIAYLENGFNGFVTNNTLEDYVTEVCKVFANDGYLDNLRKGCRISAKIYNLENMTNNFVAGIVSCLNFGGVKTIKNYKG